MARSGRFEAAKERTIADLGRDLLWLCVHSGIAVAILGAAMGAISLTRPDPDVVGPKLAGTIAAFIAPLVVGFVAGRGWTRSLRVWPARYCWVVGVVLLATASVWVMGLPTGPGMCAGCSAGEKVWRTFFVLQNGSGLLNGNGLVLGSWIPLALAGYSIGVSAGLRS